MRNDNVSHIKIVQATFQNAMNTTAFERHQIANQKMSVGYHQIINTNQARMPKMKSKGKKRATAQRSYASISHGDSNMKVYMSSDRTQHFRRLPATSPHTQAS